MKELVFLSPIILPFAFLAGVLVRNYATYSVQMKALAIADERSRAEIDAGNFTTWQRHFDALANVSYERMLLSFWRRPSSFLPDMEAK